MMDKEDHHWVLNPTTICIQWYRLWSAFGFTDYQWTSRVIKVEEYAQVRHSITSEKILLFNFRN